MAALHKISDTPYLRSRKPKGDQIDDMCAKLDASPNKKHRLLMIVFKNGDHRTVLSSGKVLDQKTPPPAEWGIPILFESLAFKVFKPREA